MEFIYPSFLLALLAIAIPIIIHLFHFRRFKKVYFTNVRFLKEVKEETSARNKLKNLLVLLSRILALAFLVFAFAQPFIPKKDTEVKTGKKSVSLFVDNSFSMESLSEDVPLIEKAKQRAREIVSAYSVEDEFQILTNDFEGRHQRLVSKEDALGLIDEISISPSVKELSKALSRQKRLLNNSQNDNKVIYLISDFQKNITDFDPETIQDTIVETNLVPLQSVQKRNISIDTCWFEAPVQMLNQTNSLIVKLRNLSKQDAENIRLSLTVDGQVKPVGNINIPAKSEVYDTVNLTITHTGWYEASLNITDYPISFDDNYYFSFNVAEKINILAINESKGNNYLDAVFKENAYFNVQNQLAGKLDYSKLSENQLIIINELTNISSGLAFELQQYVSNGGNLLVFPKSNASTASYNSFLKGFQANELESFQKQKREVGYINSEEFVFRDVFENKSANLNLPKTEGNFKLTKFASRKEEVLLRYRDGNTYVGKYTFEQGNIYLCSAPLDLEYNNLVRNGEIFVPMLYKMAIATGKSDDIAYIIGRDNVIETPSKVSSSEMVYKLKGASEEFIPEQKVIGSKAILVMNNQIKEDGYYNLFLNEEETLAKFAFNYDRKESDLEYYTEDQLESMAGNASRVIRGTAKADFTELIGERSRGVILWKWCLIAALLFLLIEVLLLRFWKT